jgi:hypothetical protein
MRKKKKINVCDREVLRTWNVRVSNLFSLCGLHHMTDYTYQPLYSRSNVRRLPLQASVTAVYAFDAVK